MRYTPRKTGGVLLTLLFQHLIIGGTTATDTVGVSLHRPRRGSERLRLMASKILVLGLVCLGAFLSGCDFSECEPTPSQSDYCDFHHGFGWWAIGAPNTHDVCTDSQFLCTNGQQTQAPLTAADGGQEPVCGGDGGPVCDAGACGGDGGPVCDAGASGDAR